MSRRDLAILALVVVGSGSGLAAMLAGAYSLQGHWSRGQLLIAAGVFAYTVAGVACANLALLDARLPPVVMKPAWLNMPRPAWLIAAIGGVCALSNVLLAFLYAPPA